MNKYIVGADEVGTGSLIWSFFVCGVRAPEDWSIPGLNDSKQLTPKRREELSAQLLECKDITHILVSRSNLEIDAMGLGVCLKLAYQEIVDKLLTPMDTMIIDGTIRLPSKDPRVSCLIKADTKIPTVMAASIIGKVHRDNCIRELANQYPVYDWDKNMGYGTAAHKKAIRQYGLCELHRQSYSIKL